MPYIITNRSGDEIVIPDGGLNSDYSIQLVGRNYENYGSIIAKTQIDLLDNFAHTSPPANPTDGQLWYDKTADVLRVYDSTNGSWLNQTPLMTSGPPSNNYNQIVDGFMYFDQATAQLYIYSNGSYFRANSPGTISDSFSGVGALGAPSLYGTNVRTIFLYDTDGVPRSVYAIVNVSNGAGQPNIGAYFQSEQIIGIFSVHDEFTVADSPAAITEGQTHPYGTQLSETGGIGLIIKPGLNLRKDSTAINNYAKFADRSDKAYGLNTGNFTLNSDGTIDDNGGDNIPASAVFHSGADSLAAVHDTWDLGAAGTTFAEAYITDYFIGNGTTGSIQPNGASVVSIGTALNAIDNIYVVDLNVTGNIDLPNGDIGTPDDPIQNTYIRNLYANAITIRGNIEWSLPIDGADDQVLRLREISGEYHSFWEAAPNQIKSIAPDANESIIIDIATETVNKTGTTPDGSPVAYDDDQEIVTLTANVDYIHTTFQGSQYISYDGNGQYTLNYPDPFRTNTPNNSWSWNPSDFVIAVGEQAQDVGGDKTFKNAVNFEGPVQFDPSKRWYFKDGDLVLIAQQSVDDVGSFTFGQNGSFTASNDITAFSDRRLKENIEPIQDALSKVNKLTGYTFNKKGDNKRRTGVIAQEVKEVLPEAVDENDEGTMSVAYGNMVGLLIQAVNELQEEVNDLKSRLDSK